MPRVTRPPTQTPRALSGAVVPQVPALSKRGADVGGELGGARLRPALLRRQGFRAVGCERHISAHLSRPS